MGFCLIAQALLGNIVGGVMLAAAINYAQAAYSGSQAQRPRRVSDVFVSAVWVDFAAQGLLQRFADTLD